MLNYFRGIYAALVMRSLTKRLARNDPRQGWDRSDKREWA